MIKRNDKQTAVSILALIALILLSALVLRVTGISQIRYLDINDRALGTIADTDGTVIAGNLKENDWNLKPEETLTIDLSLPDEPVYEGADAVVFSEYNCEVTVKYQGRTITEMGKGIDEKGDLIGDQLISFVIPDNAYGHTVQIQIVSKEKTVNSFTTPIRLMPSSDVRFSPLIHHQLAAVLFAMVALISLTITLEYFFTWIVHRKLNPGIFLFLFNFLISMWYLGYHKALYVISSSLRFNETAEYYFVYTAFIPLMIYFAITSSETKFRRFCRIMAWAFGVYALMSFVFSASRVPLNLSDLIIGERVLEAVMLAGFIIRGISIRKEFISQEKIVIRGLAAGSAIALLEIAAIALRSVSGLPAWIQKLFYLDYAAIGILLFICVLFVSYMSEAQERRELRIRQEELRKLAFADPLTGIPNRAFLAHKMKDMAELPEGFTAVFMDVDHLKTANDGYGHSTGDKLIQVMGDLIQRSYHKAGGENDLYARWGGDEFVAYFMDRKTAEKFGAILQEGVAEVNRSHVLPFETAVSIGMAESTRNADGSLCTLEKLLKKADENMYCQKAAQHLNEAE